VIKTVKVKVKVKPDTVRTNTIYIYKQPLYRPGVAQRVPGIKVPRFHDNGTGWW
jgi:hypothetical protein